MAPPLTRQDFLKIGRFVTKVCSRCLSIRSHKNLVAPQGFEPRSSESESLVLPLNEGAPANDMLPASRTHAFADCLLECTGRACQGQRLQPMGQRKRRYKHMSLLDTRTRRRSL